MDKTQVGRPMPNVVLGFVTHFLYRSFDTLYRKDCHLVQRDFSKVKI